LSAGRIVLPEEALGNPRGLGHALWRFMTTRAVGRVKLRGSLSLLQASLRRGRDRETQRQRTDRERGAVTSQARQHVLHDHILSAREAGVNLSPRA
jgi:hypothetical protein